MFSHPYNLPHFLEAVSKDDESLPLSPGILPENFLMTGEPQETPLHSD